MSGVIWSKFYWSDYESDPCLRLCSLAAQGLWMRMLCIAAQHDPIGFVCIAGQPLDVTALARMTGSAEAEVATLLEELSRNGVCSRDRLKRIYSRRMLKDGQQIVRNRQNGAKGGNPCLGGRPSPSKGEGNLRPVNPRVNPRLKPQSPEASTRVEDPCGSSNPGGAAEAVRPPDRRPASSPPKTMGAEKSDDGWSGLRAQVAGRFGEDYARTWLDPARWRAPDRAVVCRLGFAADRLRRDLRPILQALQITVQTERSPHGVDAG